MNVNVNIAQTVKCFRLHVFLRFRFIMYLVVALSKVALVNFTLNEYIHIYALSIDPSHWRCISMDKHWFRCDMKNENVFLMRARCLDFLW